MKISYKYYSLVFSFLTALLMGFLMSGVVTYLNTGIDGEFNHRWGKAFVFSFLIAFPVSIFVIPLVRKLVDKMFING